MIKKMNEQKVDLLSVSLWLFLALSLDILVHLLTSALFTDKVVFRAAISKSITIFIWIVAVLIAIVFIRKHKIKDLVNSIYNIKSFAIFVVILIVLIVINLQFKGLSTIQVIYEYHYMSQDFGEFSILIFVLQLIYYCLEASLVTLIVIFANEWGQRKYKTLLIPYGGILLSITWGAVHFLTKGVEVGLYGIVVSMIIGTGFILTKKNLIFTYILSLILFLI